MIPSGWQPDDTIAALASPPGAAARGLIRLSGNGSREVLQSCFSPDEPHRWQTARQATRFTGTLQLAGFSRQIPAAVCLWPGRRSYTGEPAAELHLPGSPPLLEAVLSQLHTAGARPARPGEYTLRAFLAGRIDLVQAEAVLGVIDAADESELQQALRQLAGGLSAPVTELRSRLLNLLADLEAGLDFVEEDIEFVSVAQCLARLDEGLGLIRQLLEQERDRGRSGDRWRVVLAGQPNAGKSTLFNRLCGTDGALVSPVRGTTRDWLAASLNWNGLPVELIDTAGQEQEIDSLTGQMQQQRHAQLEQADLVLWCFPASAEARQQQEDAGLLAKLAGLSVPWLQVRTMSDLARSIGQAAPPASIEGHLTSETAGADEPDELGPVPAGSVSVSAVTGAGLSQLVNLACARLHGAPGTGDNRLRQMLGSTQSRCRASLQEAMTALDEARTAAAAGAGDELVAMELRAALEELGQVAGSVCTNDLLDRIFSRFCIGK